MAKKVVKSNRTPITPFRFKADTLAEVDQIAAFLKHNSGIDASRADAIRYAVHEMTKSIQKKK